MSCALSDSRTLVGAYNITNMELFRVQLQSGARIARVYRMHLSEELMYSISARRVAVTRLKRCATRRKSQCEWIDCATTDSRNSRAGGCRTPFDSCGSRFDSSSLRDVVIIHVDGPASRRELIAQSEGIPVDSWCALPDGLAICDSGALLLYDLQTCFKLQNYCIVGRRWRFKRPLLLPLLPIGPLISLSTATTALNKKNRICEWLLINYLYSISVGFVKINSHWLSLSIILFCYQFFLKSSYEAD